MIKVENIKVYNIARAIYSARNAHESWDKSDSDLENDIVGENDLELAKKLYKAGTSHRKFMRQIFVSMDVTAPLFWWKEEDQYKIGTVTNSCSTMFSIHKKEFDINDFSHDYLESLTDDEYNLSWQDWINRIDILNYFRNRYIATKDKRYWKQLIEKLPSSYNQMRTLTMNYENVVNMIQQRSGHKLDEWRTFTDILRKLPYIEEITGGEL